MGDYVDKKVRETPISSKAHLKARIQEEWEKIPTSLLQKLAASMPRRLQAVVDNKGMHTKY